MASPGSQWQILNAIENDLRGTDPELVSAFAALATNRPRFHRRHRRPFPGRFNRFRCALRARMATSELASKLPLAMVIPVAILMVLSLMIFVMPGPARHRCGTVSAARGFVRPRTHCPPASQPLHPSLQSILSRPNGRP